MLILTGPIDFVNLHSKHLSFCSFIHSSSIRHLLKFYGKQGSISHFSENTKTQDCIKTLSPRQSQSDGDEEASAMAKHHPEGEVLWHGCGTLLEWGPPLPLGESLVWATREQVARSS